MQARQAARGYQFFQKCAGLGKLFYVEQQFREHELVGIAAVSVDQGPGSFHERLGFQGPTSTLEDARRAARCNESARDVDLRREHLVDCGFLAVRPYQCIPAQRCEQFSCFAVGRIEGKRGIRYLLEQCEVAVSGCDLAYDDKACDVHLGQPFGSEAQQLTLPVQLEQRAHLDAQELGRAVAVVPDVTRKLECRCAPVQHQQRIAQVAGRLAHGCGLDFPEALAPWIEQADGEFERLCFVHRERARRRADGKARAALGSDLQGVRPDEKTCRRVFGRLLAEFDRFGKPACFEFSLRHKLEDVRFLTEHAGQIVDSYGLSLYQAQVDLREPDVLRVREAFERGARGGAGVAFVLPAAARAPPVMLPFHAWPVKK